MTCEFCKAEQNPKGIIENIETACDTCKTKMYLERVQVEYRGTTEDVHVFIPIGIIYCPGCGSLIVDIKVQCRKVAGIDVTEEFKSLKK